MTSAKYLISALWTIFYLFTGSMFHQCYAAPKKIYIPDALEPWKAWVLHDREKEINCIALYNRPGDYQCAWPATLDIRLDERGGSFVQTWLVHTQTRADLPGSSRHWPLDVAVDKQPAIVLEQQNRPGLILEPGTHKVSGRFSWTAVPDHLDLPRLTGLISLQVNHVPVAFPDLDDQGRLWLKRDRTEKKVENRLKVECYRLIDDNIPAQMEARLLLDVAGTARQVTLGPAYAPDRFTPLMLDSPLPAKLEPDGRLRIQVRPGQYELRLLLRHQGPLTSMAFNRPAPAQAGLPPWPDQEIWSFKARPDLRLAEVTNVPAVDPKQTAMPRQWHAYPAFLMAPGAVMTIKQIKRGDPEPAPDQLRLDRDIWLRFDGSGYTIQDRITGTKNTDWRLEMGAGIDLGSAVVDGREQLITQRKGSDLAGLELRNGRVDMTATATCDSSISRLGATGWAHDFHQVAARMHLPPGWKLINATGMDTISSTWIKQWTLLDFFIVLIFTIALAKLYSWPLAITGFITLVLVFHEPAAPKLIWPVLLVGAALLKYLPEGRIKWVVKICQGLAVLAFAAIVIPYTIQALRIGLFPQLEKPWVNMAGHGAPRYGGTPSDIEVMPSVSDEIKMENVRTVPKATKRVKERSMQLLTQSVAGAPPNPKVAAFDPNALTQTGPGIPGWQPFETVRFSWSGPVTTDQSVGFFLIGPKTNLILAFIRVACIILLAAGMAGIGYRPGSGLRFPGITKPSSAALAFAAVLLVCLSPAQSVRANEIPSPELLAELEARLLEKAPCFPACADIQTMNVSLDPDRLSITARVNAAIDTAVPLPGNAGHWLPGQALVDDHPAPGLVRRDGHMWILVPQGRHTLTLSGPVRRQRSFQVPFNLPPRHLTVTADGWTVEGIHPDGSFDSRLEFKRIQPRDSAREQVLETGILPAFARVERTLMLGLVWKVKTRVERLSPPGSGMVLAIPLLPGESVTTAGLRVENQTAKLNFKADQQYMEWESFLEKTDNIHLAHPDTDQWTEVWQVDISPIFHLEYQGIPVVLHKAGSLWYPTWHPWPLESVDLFVTRPAGVEGATLTIEKSQMELWPGRNNTKAQLDLTVKSSQGGPHVITLPPKARLEQVRINNRVQPIRQKGEKVTLPIVPGSQVIRLTWMTAAGIGTRYRTPAVDLGAASVNAGVDLHLPRNRWPLFLGGQQLSGPAVLFWSVIIIICVIALILSKTGWTPLNFFHWFLLCLGMSMSHAGAGILVAVWLIALHFRSKADTLKPESFNLVQIGILFLTLAAGASLIFSISNGLLGHPDMNIKGNGSTASLLRWYHDISGPLLPQAWVISIPMFAYRIAMLAWALWVSFWLLGIVRWGWQQFSTPVLWQKMTLGKRRPGKAPENARDKGADT